jgi:hypothetical protein
MYVALKEYLTDVTHSVPPDEIEMIKSFRATISEVRLTENRTLFVYGTVDEIHDEVGRVQKIRDFYSMGGWHLGGQI